MNSYITGNVKDGNITYYYVMNSADMEMITQNTEIPVWEIQGILTTLEIKGLIKQISGNRYVKA